MNPSSPLKGRTASKRSQTLIRTGAHAVVKANEYRAAAAAPQNDDDASNNSSSFSTGSSHVGNYKRELVSNNTMKNINIHIRRRHKRPKLNYNRVTVSNAASWNGGSDGGGEQELLHPFSLANEEIVRSKSHYLSASDTIRKVEEQLSIPSSSSSPSPRRKQQQQPRRFELTDIIGTPNSGSDNSGGFAPSSFSNAKSHFRTPKSSSDNGDAAILPSSAGSRKLGKKISSSSLKSQHQFESADDVGTPKSSSDDGCTTSFSQSRLENIPEHGTPESSNENSCSSSSTTTSKTLGRKGPSTQSSSHKSRSEPGTPKSSNDTSCFSSIPSTSQKVGKRGPSTPSSSHNSRLDNIPEHGTPESSSDSCSISFPSTSMGKKGPSTPYSSNKSTRGHIRHPKESTPGSVVPSSQESSSTPQPVTLGGHRRFRDDTTTQDMGNYRMLIDDLSYLSSAIIQCREKITTTSPRRLQNDGETLVAATRAQHHTAVTAGVACGIAELVSQSDTRVKLLTLTAKSARGGAKVGAVEAILESVACAPEAPDWSIICQHIIDNGHGSGRSSSNFFDKSCNHKNNADCRSALDLGSDTPRSKEYDIISSKALSIVSYFVGIDCTESAILSGGPSNRLAIQLTRETVLQHKSALRGIARLVADDPVVNAYLHEASKTFTTSERCGDKLPKKIGSPERTRCRSSSRDFFASIQQKELKKSSHSDPTKSGRRSRRKRISQLSDSPLSSISADLQSKSSLGVEPKFRTGVPRPLFCRERSAGVDFSFNDGEASYMESHESDTNCANRFDLKISLAMSRIKLAHDNDFGLSFYRRNLPYDCAYCNFWTPHLISHLDLDDKDSFTSTSGLALAAADCITTGRDRRSAEIITDDNIDDGLPYPGYSNERHASHGLMSENPIVYANEMIQLSGSLPHYSRSMSETLLAILLSMNNYGTTSCCSECISYLQKRAFALSEVIDGMCCLSPNVSMTLSNHDSYLVPSLLRVILRVSLSMNDDWPFLYVDTASAALKTLTSLTHENSVASGQMLEPLLWGSCCLSSQDSNSSNRSTGVGIVFSYLFRTVSLMQTRGHQKMMYDHTIFCLNILTNTVEMESDQAKRVLDAIVVSVDGGAHQRSGLPWLAGWIVSTTSGFRESIMKGSFGSSASSAVDNELKTGEDDNLVTSGNGFVLLAYLMIGDDFTSHKIRDVVLKELPVDQNGVSGGIQFIVKVLKAFCNYYHYTVGDISVAIIAPVVKLISGLELLGMQAASFMD